MSIKYILGISVIVLTSCSSGVVTFFSIDERRAELSDSMEGQLIPTQTNELELRLYMGVDNQDHKDEHLINDTFRLSLFASPTGSGPWPIDSIMITDFEISSVESHFAAKPVQSNAKFASEFTATNWYQRFEPFVLRKAIKSVRVNITLHTFSKGIDHEESIAVKLFRKDVNWRGPPRGLFH